MLIWGGPALLSVTGAVGLEKAGRVPHWPVLSLAGDACYSIYLTHTFVISVLGKLPWFRPWPVPDGGPLDAIRIVAAIALCLGAGIAVYLWVERPMLAARRGPPEHRAGGAGAIMIRPMTDMADDGVREEPHQTNMLTHACTFVGMVTLLVYFITFRSSATCPIRDGSPSRSATKGRSTSLHFARS